MKYTEEKIEKLDKEKNRHRENVFYKIIIDKIKKWKYLK